MYRQLRPTVPPSYVNIQHKWLQVSHLVSVKAKNNTPYYTDVMWHVKDRINNILAIYYGTY